MLSRTDIFPAFGCVCSTGFVSSVLPNYAAMIHYKTLGFSLFQPKILNFSFQFPLERVSLLQSLRLSLSSSQDAVGNAAAVYFFQQRKLVWFQKHTACLPQLDLTVHLCSGSTSHLPENGFVNYRSRAGSSNNGILLQVLWILRGEKFFLLNYVPQRKSLFLLCLYKTCRFISISLPAVMLFISFIENCRFLRFSLIEENSLSCNIENHNG